jgi:coproporphyrinogen III oxidase-like Fe-S oxidoreductase
LHPTAEITLEADPGTFDATKLGEFHRIGINRLSIGVQSFDNEILRRCGRAHTAEDVTRALEAVKVSAFRDNFSIDLISSLPYLTIPLWKDTLLRAIDTGCSHCSIYDLQVEDKTAFGRWYTPGTFPLPTDEDSTEMYKIASETMRAAGFEHYEVSNYARPGKRSRHNQLYWQCAPYYAFGMGASSFIGNKRFSRPDKLEDYRLWLDRLAVEGFQSATRSSDDEDGEDDDDDGRRQDGDSSTTASSLHGDHEETLDILEVVMLALRTSDGLDLDTINRGYGSDAVHKILDALEPFTNRNLVLVETGDNQSMGSTLKVGSNPADTLRPADALNSGDDQKRYGRVRLRDPEGFLVSNDIISSVFAALAE